MHQSDPIDSKEVPSSAGTTGSEVNVRNHIRHLKGGAEHINQCYLTNSNSVTYLVSLLEKLKVFSESQSCQNNKPQKNVQDAVQQLREYAAEFEAGSGERVKIDARIEKLVKAELFVKRDTEFMQTLTTTVDRLATAINELKIT